MDRVTLQSYRCFREKQSAHLAPLTFLVGENSTGKTSFLALLRALWQVAFQDRIPDFREAPYDLGAFEDIAHNRDSKRESPATFEAEFEYEESHEVDSRAVHRVIFENRGGYPFPSIRRFSHGGTWIEVNDIESEQPLIRFGNIQNQYEHPSENALRLAGDRGLSSLRFAFMEVEHRYMRGEIDDESGGYASFDDDLLIRQEILSQLGDRIYNSVGMMFRDRRASFPFASAPVRSRPRRTYDPSRPTQDPEGEYIPDYLASMSRNDPEQWVRLKTHLEDFGQESGLFNEINVLPFGETAGAPFQVQIRKFGKRLKGPKRNLIDVGYGVSQALPILTELLREDSPRMFLLQQPEVHLHPRAQAALGSLFCNLAASGKQIIVETHSDYILDRVFMDIRDKRTPLKAEDVSILYFERDELDVNIHSIRVDEDGNVHDAPLGYRRFFMEEMRRSIGL